MALQCGRKERSELQHTKKNFTMNHNGQYVLIIIKMSVVFRIKQNLCSAISLILTSGKKKKK